MDQKMKKTLLAILFLATTAGCENLRETGGKIAGLWQLTECRISQGETPDSIVPIPASTIYFSFSRGLVKLTDTKHDGYYLCYYDKEGDIIHINTNHVVFYPREELYPADSLAKFKIPADGTLQVLHLSDSKLILGNATESLLFRKY